MKKLILFIVVLVEIVSSVSSITTYTFGQDIDYPPFAYKNMTTGELEGFGKDIAEGMTELCSEIAINVVQLKWDECWDGSTGSIGKGLDNGTYDACMTYTHTEGVRNLYVEFSDAILDPSVKSAGLIVKLNEDGVPEIVDGMDDLSNRTIVDVRGWAPTADTILLQENKCTGNKYSDTLTILPNREGTNNNDEALKMVLDGSVDAMYVYADQAYNYKKECEIDWNQEWDCSLRTKFGTDYAYVQTGQKCHLRNGTTLAMAKLDSGVADAINPCLWRFMETKEYYDICVKHDLVYGCFPNIYFPDNDDDDDDQPFLKETDEQTQGCDDGYCSCEDSSPEWMRSNNNNNKIFSWEDINFFNNESKSNTIDETLIISRYTKAVVDDDVHSTSDATSVSFSLFLSIISNTVIFVHCFMR